MDGIRGPRSTPVIHSSVIPSLVQSQGYAPLQMGTWNCLQSRALASFSKVLLLSRRQALASQGNKVGNNCIPLLCVEPLSPQGKFWCLQHLGNSLWSHITVNYSTLLYLCLKKCFFSGCKNMSSFKTNTPPSTTVWRDGLVPKVLAIHVWGTESNSWCPHKRWMCYACLNPRMRKVDRGGFLGLLGKPV